MKIKTEDKFDSKKIRKREYVITCEKFTKGKWTIEHIHYYKHKWWRNIMLRVIELKNRITNYFIRRKL